MTEPVIHPVPLDEVLARDMRDSRFAAKVVTKAKLLEIGEAVRTARESVKLTQTQLAELAGIAQPDVSEIETGAGLQGPTVSKLVRVARALGGDLHIDLGLPVADVVKKDALRAGANFDLDDDLLGEALQAAGSYVTGHSEG